MLGDDEVTTMEAAVRKHMPIAPVPSNPRRWAAGLSLTLLLAGCAAQAQQPVADLIVIDGSVYAGAGAAMAEAVAIGDRRILRVGSTEEIAALRGPDTRVVDAAGGSVLPGFNDAHVHFRAGGESLEQVDLLAAGDLEAVQGAIRAFAEDHPDDEWVLGRGWLYGSFPGDMPTRGQLDAVVPDRPAVMNCYDGHSVWVNSAALELAGIDRDTPDPEGGVIVRDPETGEPTGLLQEEAMGLIREVMPAPTREDKLRAIRAGIDEAHRLGVTSVQNAGMSPEELGLYAELEERGELGVRMYAALSAPPGFTAAEADAYEELLQRHPGTARLRTGAVKMFADGVIEGHTAAMLEPYAHRDTTGIPNYTREDMDRIVAMMDARGWQVWIHAIGDAAIRMALDAYERAAAAQPEPERGRRHRIEHVEAISAADIPRFAQLGVIASMQPFHASPVPNILDVWAASIGPERASRAWAWGSIHEAGARLALGTDWPVVGLDPRPGVHTALTRRTPDGEPEGGFVPGERLPLDTVIDAWTRGGAYASFEEHRKGTLAPGMLADVVVLSTDIFRLPPERVQEYRVRTTIFDGDVVYEAPVTGSSTGDE